MHKVFIDGNWGTTGLFLEQKLKPRKDLALVFIEKAAKKNLQKKIEAINQCSITILCLPDEAAIETVSAITNPKIKIIDASTAHRTHPDWTYGFPEMEQNNREKITTSNRVANPGCYATAAIALLRPLLKQKLLLSSSNIYIHALSGYSGGGKNLITKFTQNTLATMAYALLQNHKHLPEIKKYSLLDKNPYFAPLVGNFQQGMLVQIACFKNQFVKHTTLNKLQQCYQKYYQDEKFIEILPVNCDTLLKENFLDPCLCNGSNLLKLGIYGDPEKFSLLAILDNLGKGASSAAIQNLNLMLGLEEHLGLL